MTYNDILQKILSCPYCQSEKLVFENDELMCENCNAIYDFIGKIPKMIPKNKNNQWVEDANEYADSREDYYRRRIESNNGWWLPKDDSYLRLGQEYSFKCGRGRVINYIGENYNKSIILDLGGGEGYVLNKLAVDYPTRSNTYISYDLINILQQDGLRRYGDKIVFITGDAQYISIKKNVIDVIISTECIEHVIDIPRFLANARDVLTDGGMLCITTPNRKGFSCWYDSYGRLWINRFIKRFLLRRTQLPIVPQKYGFRQGQGSYERILTSKELKQYLFNAGFKIYHVEFTQLLGESIFGYAKRLKLAMFLLKSLESAVSRIVEPILNLTRISEYLGFTQIIYAMKSPRILS